ncbi:MAG: hypothetical protein GTO60_15915 [Gammaproteobacteria bacterium]|nr:hypothetical protein [Gammaproteobacteria bacterium]NIO63603.1 hypothetical protein [Gammaproteobacteria bacterium]
MKRCKVPKGLCKNAVEASQNIFRYEPIERYVINRVIQACREDVTVDDVFIKSAKNILANKSVDYTRDERRRVA